MSFWNFIALNTFLAVSLFPLVNICRELQNTKDNLMILKEKTTEQMEIKGITT